MKPRTAIVKVLLLAAASLGRGESVDFDKATVGAVPAGWIVAMTHRGGAPRSGVFKDDSALSKPNVLAQVSTDHTAGRFPLAIWDRTSLKDGALTVKFKAASGPWIRVRVWSGVTKRAVSNTYGVKHRAPKQTCPL